MSSTMRYTREVGRKFHADGTPRLFPGNTIICFVDPQSPIGQAAQALQATIQQQPLGARFALLPPASFHMTVMELLCDQVRVAERWSAALDLQAPLAETDTFFLRTIPPLPVPTGIQMRYQSLAHHDNLMINLAPADTTTAAALWRYREAVAQATGVRFPDHDRYGFHLSLAYRIHELEPEEEAALADIVARWEATLGGAGASIALDPPQLVFFDDMFQFVPAPERRTLRSRQPGAAG